MLIGPFQQYDITETYLERLFNLPEGAHVHEGVICTWEPQGGHNNPIEREPLYPRREATALDIAAITVLDHLRATRPQA